MNFNHGDMDDYTLASMHNIYGTLGVMSVEEIQGQLKDRGPLSEYLSASDRAQIHNIYASLGVMSVEEIRRDLELDND